MTTTTTTTTRREHRSVITRARGISKDKKNNSIVCTAGVLESRCLLLALLHDKEQSNIESSSRSSPRSSSDVCQQQHCGSVPSPPPFVYFSQPIAQSTLTDIS